MNLVIGCGNLLRGDDAVGPVLVRRLLDRGLPDGCEVADGGTSGMDVADAINNLFGLNFGLGPSPVDASYVCAPNANNQCTNTQWWSHLIGTEITRVPEPEALALGLAVLPALALFARCRAR